jgi:hypothetical protein
MHGRPADEHGVGYLIEMPGEPSLYLSGDTMLTDAVRDLEALSHCPVRRDALREAATRARHRRAPVHPARRRHHRDRPR